MHSTPVDVLKRFARRLLGKPQPARAVAVHPFDRTHGTDTSGLIERQHLRTGHANDAENTAYFGVPPSRFANAMERWQAETMQPVGQYRLIDLGCGKGRAVLLASRMLFRDVVGVELNPELVAIAQANLQLWQQAHATGPTRILCADAPTALAGLLDGPTLLYLYNPFKASVLRQVLQAAVDAHVQPVDVVYLYPEHESVFAEFPAFERIWHGPVAISSEDVGDGISAQTDPCSLYRLVSDLPANP